MSAPQRPAPPELEASPPDCSICGQETEAGPDGDFTCERCQCFWPGFWEPGEWMDPDMPQCPSTAQPFADFTAERHDWLRAMVFRCVLDTGHEGRHESPDYTFGWFDAEQLAEAPASAEPQLLYQPT